MNDKHLNIYNNLIKLTRNKFFYENLNNKDTFSDRLIIFFFHFAFFLKVYKKSDHKELQNIYDFIFKQIELSIREIGYGDATVNKKMKEFINTFYKIVDKTELWNNLDLNKKTEFISSFLDMNVESLHFVNYLNKYIDFLTKNNLNYFSKDVLRMKF